MKFLTELLAFLSSRRSTWLRPIVILLMVIGVLLLLGGGFLDAFFPRSAPDELPPLSRQHYRHDGAFLSR